MSDGFGETRPSTDAEDDEPEEVEGGQRLHRRHPERMPSGTVIIPPGPGKLFDANEIEGIEIVFTPHLP